MVLYMNLLIYYFPISNILLMLGLVLAMMVLFYLFCRNHPLSAILPGEMITNLVFLLFALATGWMVSINKAVFLSQFSTQFQTFVFMVCILAIAYDDQSTKFIEFLLISIPLLMDLVVISGISSLSAAFYSRQILYPNAKDIINPNSLGLAQAYGVFAVMTKLFSSQEKKPWKIIFLLFLLGLFFTVILISGSRKSFLAAIIVILGFLVIYRKRNVFQNIISIIIGLGVVYAIFWIGSIFLEEFYLFQRFSGFFTDTSNITRVNMYREAFDLFEKSPLVGVGIGNYTYASSFGTYSHSTYAEALACTGLIGSCIYFFGYGIILYKLFKLYKIKSSKEFAKKGFIVMGVLLFLGIGVIHFYEIYSSLVFTYLMSGIIIQTRMNRLEKKAYIISQLTSKEQYAKN